MLTIELIETKLKIMNADAFHRLCDHFLFYDEGEDFDSINPIGQVEGKQKPRKGTPDTKIKLTSGSYIFIQYTTQQDYPNRNDLLNKLTADLEDSLNYRKTKVALDKISSVILCFNSNINSVTEQQLYEIARAKFKQLRLINLSTIAHKIYKFYPFLAKEYLGIEIDSYQLLPLKKFIEEYEKGGIATPLSNAFRHREKELQDVEASINNNLITVVSGKAGVGKSRLAVEMLNKYIKSKKGNNAFCIKNKDLPIIYDLRKSLSDKKIYLLYIDDANKSIAQLREVLTFYQENQAEFKLILTLREYVLGDILPFVQNYSHQIITINPFDSQQIKGIISASPFNIKNPLFQDRIKVIAHGNARLAVMTAMASKNRKLSELDNISDIYSLFFEKVIGDNPFLSDNDYLRVLGVLAFFRIIDRDDTENYQQILQAFNLDDCSFWTKIYDLERHEIVDVFTDRSSVKFSDQILEGYLFYRVFFIDKLLDYNVILSAFFPKYSHRIQYTAIDANNTFGFKNFGDLIGPFITQKYHALNSGSEDPLVFLSIFWLYLQDETLLFIKNRIESLDKLPDLIPEDKIVLAKFNTKTFGFKDDTILDKDIKDDFFDLIAEFVRHLTDDFNLAVELLLNYVERNQKLAEKFVQYIRSNFSFSYNDEVYNYYREEHFSRILIEKIKTGTPVFKYVFLKVLPHFLHTRFDTSFSEGMQISIQYTQPYASPKFIEIRKLYWERFSEIYQDYPRLSLFSFKAVLDTFGPDFNKEVRIADWPEIEAVFERNFDLSKFADAYAVNQFVERIARKNVDKTLYAATREKALTKEYKWFQALDWNLLRNKERFEKDGEDFTTFRKKFDELKRKEILKTFAFSDLESYKQVFNFIGECVALDVWEYHNVFNAAQVILDNAFEKKINIPELFRYLVHQSFFYRIFLYERLFNILQKESSDIILQIGEILESEDYPEKQFVLLSYFNCLRQDLITGNTTRGYLRLILNLKGRYVFSFSNLDSYLKNDSQFLAKAISSLLQRDLTKECDFEIPDDFIEQRFAFLNKSISIAESLYLHMMATSGHYDYEGSELLFIIDKAPAFINTLLQFLIDEKKVKRNETHQLGVFWKSTNFKKHLTKAVDFLAAHDRYHYQAESILSDLFDDIVRADNFKAKRISFLKDYITTNANNLVKMKAAFKLICSKIHEEMPELLTLYLSRNSNITHFKKIEWTARGTRLISGNAITAEIDERAWLRAKTIVETIEPKINYLEHRTFINLQIDHCRKRAVGERKWNFLRDRY